MNENIKTGLKICQDVKGTYLNPEVSIKKRLSIEAEKWASLSWLKEQIQKRIKWKLENEKEYTELTELEYVLSLLEEK